MNVNDIKDLILTIDKSSIEKVEIEKSDIKIMITKKATIEDGNTPQIDMESSKTINATKSIVSKEIQEYKNEAVTLESADHSLENNNDFIVKAPIVGTFYEAASPDSEPFVKVGDKVEKGQVLCIIEAMKIMNEIECESDGEIVEIYVSDEEIIEYGQPLMRIKRR